MKSENLWWKGMSYTVSFACPICSPQPAICRDDTGVHYLDEKEILESGALACVLHGGPDMKKIPRESYRYWLERLDRKVRVLRQLVASTGVRYLGLHILNCRSAKWYSRVWDELFCFLCGDLSRAGLGNNTTHFCRMSRMKSYPKIEFFWWGLGRIVPVQALLIESLMFMGSIVNIWNCLCSTLRNVIIG